MSRNDEHNLQSMMVRWFDLIYPDLKLNLFAVPNGQNKNAVQRAKFKREGLRSGVSDLVFIYKGNTIFIEVKTKTGRQSDTQKAFQESAENNYFNYYLVRSLEEFQEIIVHYIELLDKIEKM